MPLKAFGMHARVLYAAQGFRARTHYAYRFVRWIKYTTFAHAMSRQMSNALYIKTASKKPPKSGLNAFMSRKSDYLRMYLAINFCILRICICRKGFCGITHSKVAAYDHFKVYDVCSFHSG